jgi:hypothetical protein
MKVPATVAALLGAGVAFASPVEQTSNGMPLAQAQAYERYLESQMNDLGYLQLQTPDAKKPKGGLGGGGSVGPISCKPLIIIFARGTFEPPPAPGLLVGHSFTSAVQAEYPGKVAVQAVKYGAGIMGYLTGGDAAGSKTMAQMVENTASKCPNSRIVMGGYSQGGQVVHKAANMMSSDAARHVKAVVIFGDPDKGKKMKGIDPSEVDTMCASSDPICYGLPIPLGAHLTYGSKGHTKEAAKWLKEYLGPNLNGHNTGAQRGIKGAGAQSSGGGGRKKGKMPSFGGGGKKGKGGASGIDLSSLLGALQGAGGSSSSGDSGSSDDSSDSGDDSAPAADDSSSDDSSSDDAAPAAPAKKPAAKKPAAAAPAADDDSSSDSGDTPADDSS